MTTKTPTTQPVIRVVNATVVLHQVYSRVHALGLKAVAARLADYVKEAAEDSTDHAELGRRALGLTVWRPSSAPVDSGGSAALRMTALAEANTAVWRELGRIGKGGAL